MSIEKIDDLDEVTKRLKITLDEIDNERAIQIKKLEDIEKQLRDRLRNLDEEKHKTASANGDVNASGNDILEINAGGKVVTMKRATLLQLQGSRLEAMFSGRWDKKLTRDNYGRIFLDVNGDCFQAIVDYMNELAISSEDEPPDPPSVDDELQHILQHQMYLFRLVDHYKIESNIVTGHSDAAILRNWLEEDGIVGELELLYRSSRDGQSGSEFHSKCDNKGPTVVIIETHGGGVIGGYTSSSWKIGDQWTPDENAFLFALSGFEIPSPCKMKLKNANRGYAIYNNASYGPTFGGGHDLRTIGGELYLNLGHTYERGPFGPFGPFGPTAGCLNYDIKEVEVFQVTDNPTPLPNQRKKRLLSRNTVEKVEAVNMFSEKVNGAINDKWTALQELEVEVLSLEESFRDEELFIESFGSGDINDIVMLNVSGTVMAISRAALLLCKDSVLAQQFDDSKWKEQGSTSPRVNEWAPDDVTNWVKSVKDVPDEIATLFWENEIKGSELLALDKDGLDMIGVKRVGTVCLLLKEIRQLEEASQDTATLIEYSPYCFGKVLDYLRLKHLHTLGLIDEPALPTVCESQKKRFEKVVKYYFPGKSSKFILG